MLMADSNPNEVIVPVVSEEFHADALPVETGSVRVVKRVEGHDEILEQELRRGRAELKRVKMERVVDGPQAVRREGDTLIIPVVSEILRVEKQWVVTEEIHITQIEEREKVQQKVTVNREVAEVERLDQSGKVISSRLDTATGSTTLNRPRPGSVGRSSNPASGAPAGEKSTRKVLSRPESSILQPKK